MKMNKCLICNSQKQIVLETKFNFVSSDIKKIKYSQNFFVCKSCGCLQKKINKKYLRNISTIYKNYEGFSKYNQIDQKKIINGVTLSRCELLFKKFLNKKKFNEILDYGSSNGAMLIPFLDTNKKLYATDLKCNLNSKIIKSKNFVKFISIKNFENSKKKFDLITLIHVLEHLHKPTEILSNLAKKLKKKGIIFIQIPNFLLNPFDLCVYDHTIHFDIDSLNRLASACDLKIIGMDDKLMNGEFSIILKKTNKIKKITNINYPILKKINYFKNFEKKILKIKRIKNLSILGTSISSLFIKHNFKGKIKNIYDEDLGKIGKKFEGIKVKKLTNNNKENLFLPFFDKKLTSIKKRIKKNYHYNLICLD